MLNITRLLGESNRDYISYLDSLMAVFPYGDTEANREKKPYYHFIPTHNFEGLSTVYSKLKVNKKYVFCDLGCGLGNMLNLASKLGFDVMGIEYEKGYCTVLKKLINRGGRGFNASEKDIIQGDLLTFDYSKLAHVDVFYAYCPIRDDKMMQEVINMVTAAMKPGAYFVYNPANTAKVQGITRITDTVYQKPLEDVPKRNKVT